MSNSNESKKEQLFSILFQVMAMGKDVAAHESQRETDPQAYSEFQDYVCAQVEDAAGKIEALMGASV